MNNNGLRPYQTQAKTDSFTAWREGARNILAVMATGTGKTVYSVSVAGDVIRKSAKKSIFLAHRVELIDQAFRTFQAQGLKPVVEMAENTPRGKMFDFNVVIASVQSLSRDNRLLGYNPDDYNLIIVDEAHHATSATYRKILNYFPNCKVLGLTATPFRSDKVGLKNVFDKVAFEYPIADGIQDGFLCPVKSKQVVVDGLHLESINITQGEFNEQEITALLMIEENLQQMVVPTLELAGKRPTIVFCTDVAHATAINATFNRLRLGSSVLIHGGMSQHDRKRSLEYYESGRAQFIVNCMILTEGYDHPPTACVAIFRPTKSLVFLCQAVGRSTRISPGKADTLILDFVGAANTVQTVNVLDVLDGTVIDEETKKKAQGLVDAGEDALTALDSAKADIAKLRQMQARMKAQYSTTSSNLSVILGIKSARGLFGGENVTPKQKALLIKMGVDVDRDFQKGEAMRLISEIFDRRKRGLSTVKQARFLLKNGVADAWDLPFTEASAKIAALLDGK